MTKKRILIFLVSVLALSFPGCAPGPEEARLTVVCTTYPIYLFARSVAEEVDGVCVERLDTGSVSCLHDYTLSMEDMKKLERADVIALNGAGLEDFLESALAASGAAVIDCSEGIDLLENRFHDHDEDEEDGHWDPHYWMDPGRAAVLARNLEAGLSEADPDHRGDYQAGPVLEMLDRCRADLDVFDGRRSRIPGLITFHDGFQYFAQACGIPLLASVEEEAGSEASAREIVEITRLVKAYRIPVIFTEVNGSEATAAAISRETGCGVARLTMLMDGPDSDLEAYYTGITKNSSAILRGFAIGEEEP